MKETYPEDMMLCFVQSFDYPAESNNNIDGQQTIKKPPKKVSLLLEDEPTKLSKSSSADFLKRLPEVKRSLSDRFSIIADGGKRREGSRRLMAIRKTRSTGNFVGAGGGASGGGGGGGGAASGARSAPATPLQSDTQLPRAPPATSAASVAALPARPDKNAVKQLSGGAGGAGAGSGDSGESKAPSKARQKKFLRNFPQVGPDERVLNYYSCALVGDILLQGHLYITKNYFAFYSNVFGYVTKLLIPTASVLRVSKEKMARIIPNAVGVCTRDERHVFGSLLSRDSTYKLMLTVWKAAQFVAPVPVEELRISEVELDASEYSPEDESSSGGGEPSPPLHPRCVRRAPPAQPTDDDDAIITAVKTPTVIQPSLLLGAPPPRARVSTLLLVLTLVLAASALVLARAVCLQRTDLPLDLQDEADSYDSLLARQSRLHGQAAAEAHAFLNNNLQLLAKVRQSLEALSTIILVDTDRQVHPEIINYDTTPPTTTENPQEAGVS